MSNTDEFLYDNKVHDNVHVEPYKLCFVANEGLYTYNIYKRFLWFFWKSVYVSESMIKSNAYFKALKELKKYINK